MLAAAEHKDSDKIVLERMSRNCEVRGYRKNTVIKEQTAASGRYKERQQLVLHRGDSCQLLMNGGQGMLDEAR